MASAGGFLRDLLGSFIWPCLKWAAFPAVSLGGGPADVQMCVQGGGGRGGSPGPGSCLCWSSRPCCLLPVSPREGWRVPTRARRVCDFKPEPASAWCGSHGPSEPDGGPPAPLPPPGAGQHVAGGQALGGTEGGAEGTVPAALSTCPGPFLTPACL